MKSIYSKIAPQPIGPYSQAVAVENLLFCSGQVGVNPQTGEIAEGIEEQTNQVMKNIQTVLKAGGSDLDHIVKTTIFLKNIQDFPVVNKIYGDYFSIHKPARSTVEVSNLPKGKLKSQP